MPLIAIKKRTAKDLLWNRNLS